jgi:hypothetical protein
VVDDVRELIREQPDVQGVQHRPHAGDGVVGLEMFLVVPTEGPDAVAGAHPEAVQRCGEAARPGGNLPEAGPADVRAGEGGDLGSAVDPAAVTKDVANRQRE